MNEFCVFGIAAVLFALTFAIAGWTASFVSHGISLINLCSGAYGDCVDTSSGQMFIIAAFFAIVSLGFGGAAWLVLRVGDIPHRRVMPVWLLSFVAVVGLLTLAGESVSYAYTHSPLSCLVAIVFAVYLGIVITKRPSL